MSETVSDDVREIIDELDADGTGFHTSEAALLLVHRYTVEGICTVDGDPKPKVRTLMRAGAGLAFRNYKAAEAPGKRKRSKIAASLDEQHDFQEMSEDFDHQWLMVYSAFDESEEAPRKMLVRMTLPEVLAVIALKRKKAAEATATANRLQEVVDSNPHWRANPELTVADILDINEGGAQ